MGHRNTEMIIKHYGRWLPDKSIVAGYKTVNDWGLFAMPTTLLVEKGGKL